MTESFQIIATLAAAQVAIAIAPGPNTVLVVHAGAQDRRLGFAVVAGIWPVGIVWAIGGLLGLGAVLTALPELASVMRILCGLYLTWLGLKAIRRSFAAPLVDTTAAAPMSPTEAFRAGVLSTLTNPKIIAYYMSIFTATGAHGLSAGDQMVAAVLMPTISSAWFALLAVFVSSRPVATVVGRGRTWFDRLAGLTMIGFGAKLLASRG